MPVSGTLVLPITNGPNFDGSYVTQMFTAEFKIPSNLSERYFDLLGSLTRIEELILSFSNESFTFVLASVSLIRIKFQGCENPTEGAWCAALSIFDNTFSSIGSEVK